MTLKRPRRPKKPRPKPREGLERPFNDGRWTQARMREFISKALRKAKWPPIFEVMKRAFVGKGISPVSGRPCKLYQCEQCGKQDAQSRMEVDHIEPVIGPEGFVDWNTYVVRLFVEQEKLRVLCERCHLVITLTTRYKIAEEDVDRYLRLIQFKKFKAHEQQKTLEKEGISTEGLTNAAKRIEAFRGHLGLPEAGPAAGDQDQEDIAGKGDGAGETQG